MARRNLPLNLNELLDHQSSFNQQVWSTQDRSLSETIERLKDLVLLNHEELSEFIRTYDFKTHRRSVSGLQNVAHSHEELVDIFKYWMSLALLAEFPFDRLEELYYAKSRVVQYRFQIKMMKNIESECVVIDIDNVLADYISGMCAWIRERAQSVLRLNSPQHTRLMYAVAEISDGHTWINDKTLRIDYAQWQKLKHDFRINGGKRTLPVFADAKPFLEWCRGLGWTIILLTSRPIDTYPNLLTDTMTWLETSKLPYDFLWWAVEKAIRIEEADIRHHIRFAVDDAPQFVEQFRARQIPCYLLDRSLSSIQAVDPARDHYVTSLMQVIEREGKVSNGLQGREA